MKWIWQGDFELRA